MAMPNYSLQRTLRTRDNGAANCHPLLVWREVPHRSFAAGDKLLLIACDNFNEDCTVVSVVAPEPFLEEMQSPDLLRAYSDP
ncbi:MAG: hypothetical protein ABTQ93_07625 [Candidatus Competibacter denitrificans]